MGELQGRGCRKWNYRSIKKYHENAIQMMADDGVTKAAIICKDRVTRAETVNSVLAELKKLMAASSVNFLRKTVEADIEKCVG